jgi:hypothetical protein
MPQDPARKTSIKEIAEILDLWRSLTAVQRLDAIKALTETLASTAEAAGTPLSGLASASRSLEE